MSLNILNKCITSVVFSISKMYGSVAFSIRVPLFTKMKWVLKKWNLDSTEACLCAICMEDRFFVSTWIVNKQTGRIVITGHYDSNNNGKYDKTDKNQLLIYDLKTLKLIN
ncbi:hypothetical protein HDC92_001222 [Pedobacter sp. AK017]|nr:hypothetical protein [Pedobacter sp. AK017]